MGDDFRLVAQAVGKALVILSIGDAKAEVS